MENSAWMRAADKSSRTGSHLAIGFVPMVLVVLDCTCCRFTFGLGLSTDVIPNLKGACSSLWAIRAVVYVTITKRKINKYDLSS